MFSSWLPRPALDVLESDRLLLRGLTRKDYEAWMHLRWVNSQWLQPWDPTDPAGRTPTTTFQQMVRSQRQSALEGTGYCWVVTLKDPHAANPPLIGQVSLSGIQLGAARSASIGYWIDHGHAGFGYIPEAVAWWGTTATQSWGCTGWKSTSAPKTRPACGWWKSCGSGTKGCANASCTSTGSGGITAPSR
ncbi:GNAT family N-acetyltransferase [Arthrobacter sp. JCM 19049]|uniref:GNAT family N-acetyltransferase n=1 Tax=Arthrobacter sp. JCM 19049 TaxID=1460643 RepID=UPI000A4C79E1|nr:GNAT family N-acetyltransferase [Arthrobacter sp. JCM 19049]